MDDLIGWEKDAQELADRIEDLTIRRYARVDGWPVIWLSDGSALHFSGRDEVSVELYEEPLPDWLKPPVRAET